MKILRIGDPHIRPSNINESNKLFAYIEELAFKEKINRIELLGDQFHTHAVLRLEAIEFWDFWFNRLSKFFETVVLVGNHDISGDHGRSGHAMSVFHHLKNENLKIIDQTRVLGPIGYISYTHDKNKFIELSNSLVDKGCKVLVCHQTFNGAAFENGFYAPDGIDANSINIPVIISGHIHAQQEFGKVIYPGTARWDSVSDANQPKGVWIYEHDDNTGAILNRNFYSTENVCTPIRSYVWKEGEEFPVIPDNVVASVECIGSSIFINKAKEQLKGKVKIKTKVTDKVIRENRKSSASVLFFLENSYKTTVDKEKLKAYLKEKQYV